MLRRKLLLTSLALFGAAQCLGQDGGLCASYNTSNSSSQNKADAQQHTSYNHQVTSVFGGTCAYSDQTNSNSCAIECTVSTDGLAIELGTVEFPDWHDTGSAPADGVLASNGPQVQCGGQLGGAVRSCIIGVSCNISVSANVSASGIGGSFSYSANPLWSPTLTYGYSCRAQSIQANNPTDPDQPPPTCGGSICTNCVPPSCGGIEAWSVALCSCVIQTSPILIDTDGKGFHLSSAANGVLFDFLGNGKMMQLGWPVQGSSNGWLAMDRNGNGKIDNATELFGNVTAQPPNKTPNGFAALAVFDLNHDGVIDAQDAVWPKLLVWIDANHDGVSQPGELHSLEDIGIKAISLDYKGTPYSDPYGNKFRYKGQLFPVKADDVDRVIYDVFLISTTPTT